MTETEPLMSIPYLWIVSEDPHDPVPEVDALAGRLVDPSGLDQLRDGTQSALGMIDHSIHPCTLADAQESHLEASQATRFFDVVVDEPGCRKEVRRLLFDGFELIGYLEDLDRCVQASGYATT